MNTSSTRIRHARRLWVACGLILASMLVTACVLTSVWQRWQLKSELQQWHQASVSLMAQSMAVQVETFFLQAPPSPINPTRVNQVLEQSVSKNPKLLSATLQSPEQQTWVWPPSQASTPAGTLNLAETGTGAVTEAETVTVNRTFSWPAGSDWHLQLVFKKADTAASKTSQLLYTLIACILALAVQALMLRWLWQQQVNTPLAHWQALGKKASQGLWESPAPAQNAHALIQASHDAVQRVRLRAQWIRWQQAQWAKYVAPVTPVTPLTSVPPGPPRDPHA